jgi:HEAT repeat protein
VFPLRDEEGRVIKQRKRVFELVRAKTVKVYAGTVLRRDRTRDLAVVQLESLPEGTQALPLSDKGASEGQELHAIGNPGKVEALWGYVSGKVRNVAPMTWKAAAGPGKVLSLEALVVFSDMATNPGDSGGPVVNSFAQVVAVTQGGRTDARGVSYSIDVSEVKKLLTACDVPLSEVVGPDGDPLDPRAADLARQLDHASPKKRAEAARKLAELGAGARPALRGLLKALKDRNEAVRHHAALALEQIGTLGRAELPTLTEALADKNLDVRLFAAKALERVGAEAKPAAPALVKALGDKDPGVRRHCAGALGKIGPSARDAAFKPLLKTVQDADADVRKAALTALVKLGDPSAEDVPVLQRLLKDSAARLEGRIYAVVALGVLGTAARATADDLVEVALRDDDRRVRRAALMALAKIRPDGKPAVTKLTEALGTLRDDKDLRLHIVQVLASVPLEAGPLPALLAALSDKDDAVSKAAQAALTRHSTALDKTHATHLGKALRSPTPAARAFAAGALVKLGADAKEAMPQLRAALGDASPDARAGAIRVLMKLGPDAKPAADDLTKLLKEDDALTRLGAALTLVGIGARSDEEVKPLLPILIASLQLPSLAAARNPVATGQVAAAQRGLVALGKPAVEPLIKAIQGDFRGGNRFTGEAARRARARAAAVEVLGRIGPAAKSTRLLLFLNDLLRDRDLAVREAAREARRKVLAK